LASSFQLCERALANQKWLLLAQWAGGKGGPIWHQSGPLDLNPIGLIFYPLILRLFRPQCANLQPANWRGEKLAEHS